MADSNKETLSKNNLPSIDIKKPKKKTEIAVVKLWLWRIVDSQTKSIWLIV